MATLIPAIGSSSFDSTGERRLAERLEQKLDADYLLWHNVPIGPKQTHPDFVVLHARRGLLVLETKDWRLQTVQDAIVFNISTRSAQINITSHAAKRVLRIRPRRLLPSQ